MFADVPDQELLTRLLGGAASSLPPLGDALVMSEADLLGLGLAPSDVTRLHIVAEIARRHQPTDHSKGRILEPRQAVELLSDLRTSLPPRVALLLLNATLHVIGRYDAPAPDASDQLARTLIDVARDAHAAAVVVARSRAWSETVGPTADDLDVSNELRVAGGHAGIEVVDHLVVGVRDWFSLRSLGLLP